MSHLVDSGALIAADCNPSPGSNSHELTRWLFLLAVLDYSLPVVAKASHFFGSVCTPSRISK